VSSCNERHLLPLDESQKSRRVVTTGKTQANDKERAPAARDRPCKLRERFRD